MTHSLTLRPAAKQCGISLQTSFRWRHRFLQVVEHDQAPELSGIAELDETFFRESFKGQKRNLPRPPRKRGNDKKTECRQIPVMVARDRSKQTVDGVLENGSAQELCRHLNGRINIETVVCADASLAHEKLARTLGFTFKELVASSGVRIVEGVFHLQNVNAYHSHLKGWISGVFHGVATKYLSHYLGWRRALTGMENLTIDRLANKILEFIHFNLQAQHSPPVASHPNRPSTLFIPFQFGKNRTSTNFSIRKSGCPFLSLGEQVLKRFAHVQNLRRTSKNRGSE